MAGESGPCDQRLTGVLSSQLRAYWKDPYPNFVVAPADHDIRVWYVLVGGLGAPFTGGEYLFKLTAPNEFPHQPPSFEFLTPNGVYEPGGRICISISEFHANDAPGADGAGGWRASLGMKGFAMQVVNGMICSEALGEGIRIVAACPVEKKRRLAKESRAYNRKHHRQIVDLFEGIMASKPDSAPVQAILSARGAPSDEADSVDLAAAPAPRPAAASAKGRGPAFEPLTVAPPPGRGVPRPAGFDPVTAAGPGRALAAARPPAAAAPPTAKAPAAAAKAPLATVLPAAKAPPATAPPAAKAPPATAPPAAKAPPATALPAAKAPPATALPAAKAPPAAVKPPPVTAAPPAAKVPPAPGNDGADSVEDLLGALADDDLDGVLDGLLGK
jgi:ubiquitin-conjugating enzyme E2 J2